MELSYKINVTLLTASDCFGEASAEELRVLVALIATGGHASSCESLAAAARVSRARCASALTLWRESGMIVPFEELDTGAVVIDEFEDDPLADPIYEEDSAAVARSIRDHGRRELYELCARYMNRPTLSTQETKQINALMDQLGLSEEYILALCAHLAAKPDYVLTPRKLVNKATRLYNRDITTAEELDRYIKEEGEQSAIFWEYRRVLGISGDRSLTESEKKYFKTWSEDYGFGSPIISFAYDITVDSTAGRRFPYMHKLLTVWHEAGCKTVEECRANHEAHRAENAAKYPARKSGKKATVTEKPRYSNDNADDVLLAALNRSYGTEENDDDNA